MYVLKSIICLKSQSTRRIPETVSMGSGGQRRRDRSRRAGPDCSHLGAGVQVCAKQGLYVRGPLRGRRRHGTFYAEGGTILANEMRGAARWPAYDAKGLVTGPNLYQL